MNRSPRNYTVAALIAAVCALVGLASVQGCDTIGGTGSEFLDKPPGVDVDKDSVFSNTEMSERFLVGAYDTLPYGLPTRGWNSFQNEIGRSLLASLTDINQDQVSWNRGVRFYYNGQYSPDKEEGGDVKYPYLQSGAWDGIRKSWVYIENADASRLNGMSGKMVAQRKAEAKTIIALHYSDLFRNFGGVPWAGHAFTTTENLKRPRMTAKATVDSIAMLLDEAIPDLPVAVDDPDEGRMTKMSALGLKARILLFAASPLFNDSEPYMSGAAADQEYVWFGGYDAGMWQRAADAAREAIEVAEQSSNYELIDTGNPREDFRNGYLSRGSSELLISTRHTFTGYGGSWYYYFFRQQDRAGGGPIATTDNYVKMFPMADGTPITAPNSGWTQEDRPYENRDPRLYETVTTNGSEYQNRTAQLYVGGKEYKHGGGTGYKGHKFILDEQDAYGQPQQWPYLRLSEVYLSYAEALNEANGGPTADAYKYVNKVRNRVDLPDLESGLSQEEFREAVLRERVLELGYEKVRWFDLIRWKDKEDMTKTLYGMEITQDGEGGYDYERYPLANQRYWAKEGNWSPKWYLSAFPQSEMNKDYGLVQNPGW